MSKKIDFLIKKTRSFSRKLREISVLGGEVAYLYLPLEYAWDNHCQYLEFYATGKKKVLFLGMNPGPFGMAQTGIPFGEIAAVRDWMKIQDTSIPPSNQHPKRPILGFDCPRSEVSGKRLWSLFSARFPKAKDFFVEHFVVNYCPIIWLSQSGKNLTPEMLPKAYLEEVEAICLDYLKVIITLLEPEFLVGIGNYAQK